MPINFFLNEVSFPLRNRKKLKQFIIGIFESENTVWASVSFIICTDEYLLAINQQFLQHSFYTDTITFTLSGAFEPINGEIYISADRIRENAALSNSGITEEMHRVMFHSVLHLCGYNDKTKREKELMRRMEDKYLALYFL